jgi:hypothetical protein
VGWNSLVDDLSGGNVDATPRRRRRSILKLFVIAGWLLVLAATFLLGYGVARYDAGQALLGVEALRAEAALLSEEVARARAERVRLERAHQMDREAKRQAQQSLAELQRERLLLSKRVSYLQRLVRDGEKGIVEVKELQLTKLAGLRRFRFEMVLSQLVPEAGRTRGSARLQVVLRRGEGEEAVALAALPGSSPEAVRLDFQHFQIIRGTIVLPEGATAEQVIVDIEPEGEMLASSSEVFLWPPEPGELTVSPLPVVATAEVVDAIEVE